MHTCIHTYIHTYIHIYIKLHTYIQTYTHTHIHTYTHTHIHTYTHTHIHKYAGELCWPDRPVRCIWLRPQEYLQRHPLSPATANRSLLAVYYVPFHCVQASFTCMLCLFYVHSLFTYILCLVYVHTKPLLYLLRHPLLPATANRGAGSEQRPKKN